MILLYSMKILEIICNFFTCYQVTNCLLSELFKVQRRDGYFSPNYLIFLFRNVLSKPEILKLFSTSTNITVFLEYYTNEIEIEFIKNRMWTNEEKKCIVDLIECAYECNSKQIQIQFHVNVIIFHIVLLLE